MGRGGNSNKTIKRKRHSNNGEKGGKDRVEKKNSQKEKGKKNKERPNNMEKIRIGY